MVKVLSKINPKKNSALKKIRRIGTMAANFNIETALKIFLLQDCSEEVLNAEKAKLNLWTKKDLESPGFRNKTGSNPEMLTVNVWDKGVPNHDFLSTKEILLFIKKEKDPVLIVLLADAEMQNANLDNDSPTREHIFGRTLGDNLKELRKQFATDHVKFYDSARILLNQRKDQISKCLTECWSEFQVKFNEKVIETNEKMLNLSFLRNETDNCLVRSVAHLTLGVDILFHRREKESGNFISVSEAGRKYLEAIHTKLTAAEVAKHENSDGFWVIDSNVIHCGKGRISRVKFNEIVEVIENAVLDCQPAIASRTGTEMPARESKHNGVAPHHDTAMAHVQLPEREVSASQVA